MVERSTINQSCQIGLETTPGTLVPTTKRLGSIGFNLSPQGDFNTFRPSGQKYPSLAILGKEWSEAEIEGTPTYTELPYIFSSLMSTATVTVDATVATAWKWVFDSATFGNDTPKTYTIEQGDSTRAHRAGNVIISEFGMNFSREEIECEGTALAKAIEDGVVLTSSPTTLPQIPVRPTEVSLFIDPTAATLGTTKLTRALKAEFSISDRYSPLWVIDAAQTSFVTTVEGEPDFEFKLTQEADAAGMAHLTKMRTGGTSFLRIEAIGPVIGAGPTTHKLVIDIAGQVNENAQFDDEDGVYAAEWGFAAVHDSTWGKAFHVEITTTTAAL